MNNITVEKLIPGGQGIATLPDGKKGLFWNALPGEIIAEYQITKNKSHYLEAIATKIIQKSSHRIQPHDLHFLSTSPWQIFDYSYELEQKSILLTESFYREGLTIDNVTVQTDNKDLFYRNKMEYSLYYAHEDQQIHLAFHQRGSHRKIPIEQSSLERPEILAAAKDTIAQLNASGEEARKYQSLLLRTNQTGQISGGLYENGKPHPSFSELKDIILDHEYSYSPNGFFQINLPVYEMALKEMQKYVQTDQVLDLYAGVGTIGLSIARGHQLTLVETDHSAFKELSKNCLGIGQAILANSEDVLDFINSHTTVILDPPRAGCHQKLLEKLLTELPPVIIYLSCNPSTQARDIKILSSKYSLELIQPYNFFPRTPHLENLAILKPKRV